MPTWVALLRGINLGRTNKIEMNDLRDMLEGLACKHVRTHLQSGNAIFTATGKARELERNIAGRIKRDVGLEIKVMIRSAGELAKTVRDNPMSRAKGAEKELQVAFLSAQPTAAKVRSLEPEAYAPDEFHVGRRVIYLRLPNGFQGSRLPNWEKVLGVDATIRTWKTVTRLLELAMTSA